jgi:hypothetical protein
VNAIAALRYRLPGANHEWPRRIKSKGGACLVQAPANQFSGG